MTTRNTMDYTHQQIGGRDKTCTTMYPRPGEFYNSGIYEYPVYSGNFFYETRFRPDDRRLPDMVVSVNKIDGNPTSEKRTTGE